MSEQLIKSWDVIEQEDRQLFLEEQKRADEDLLRLIEQLQKERKERYEIRSKDFEECLSRKKSIYDRKVARLSELERIIEEINQQPLKLPAQIEFRNRIVKEHLDEMERIRIFINYKL